MFFQNINLVVVLISAFVGVVLGMVWFSPYLFGKMWVEGIGLTKESSKKMLLSYSVTIVLTFISAFTIAVLYNSLVVVGGIGSVLLVPFLLWLAFAVPVVMNDYLWCNKPFKLIAISLGYTLVSLSIMSLIIALFS